MTRNIYKIPVVGSNPLNYWESAELIDYQTLQMEDEVASMILKNKKVHSVDQLLMELDKIK